MSIISIAEARALLDGGFTCAIYHGERVHKSQKRGVAPLLEWLENGEDYNGFSAVDKVVGKAAAFLYVLLGVKKLYAFVLSEGAEKVLLSHGIAVEYQEKVPAIRNRTNTGFCPMEQAVWDIDEPNAARLAVLKTLESLRNAQQGENK